MRYLYLPIFLSLAGCAAIAAGGRDYVEPSTGDIAKIRFSTNGELSLIPNRSCMDWSSPGAGVVVTDLNYLVGRPRLIGQTIGMLGMAPKDYKSAEVRVAGDKPLTVSFSSMQSDGGYVYTCSGTFTFLPKTGEEYQVTLVHDGPGNTCSFEPASLTNPRQRVMLYRVQDCK